MMKRVLSIVLAAVMALGLFFMAPTQAHAASQMDASEDCIRYLKNMEGFSAKPFWDYAQYTVGFGNRCPSEDYDRYMEEGIPIEEAHALFAMQLAGFVRAVNAFLDRKGITLKQNQFDALVSLAYNKGGAWMYADNDPLVHAILKGDMGNEIIAAFSLSCLASGGIFLPGLVTRRLSEANMYINGVYSIRPPSNYCYVVYDANGGTKSRTAQGYDSNLTATPMATATYDGHIFLGWYTAKEGGTKVTKLDASTAGMTLYAHWWDGTGERPEDAEDNTESVLVRVTTSVLNVRSGPGTSYGLVGSLTAGTVVGITMVQDVSGVLWGQCQQGWICLAYTDYDVQTQQPEEPKPSEPAPSEPGPTQPQPPVVEEDPMDGFPQGFPMTGTVMGTNNLVVYNGPHSSYPQVGTLKEGDKVTVLEVYELFGIYYGRTEGGWVRMFKNIVFEGYTPLAHSFTATVTSYSVSVRSGPHTDFIKIGTVNKNAKLEITSILEADGTVWGQYSGGWICLEYTDYDSSKLSSYQNHTMSDWEVVSTSTCSQAGQRRRSCKDCEYVEIQEDPLLEHTFTEWEDASDGNCTTAGRQKRTCTVCQFEEFKNTATGSHVCGEWETVTEATCQQTGLLQRKCQLCDYVETQVTAKVDHSYGDWYEVKAPTDTQEGQERRDCTVCDHYETRSVAKTEHEFGQWVETTAPTCTEAGIARRTCTHCDHYEEKKLPATGHSLGSWAVHQAATCTVKGQERRTCTHCDYYESREIALAEHKLGQWKVHKTATCTAAGEERRTCTACSHYESREIKATGHSYGSWTQVKAPTYTTEGQERRDCTKCDHYETRSVACKPKPVEKTYGTLTGYSFLRIRKGLGTNYGVAGELKYGQRVEILEQQKLGSVLWGRIDRGWICITGYMTLETVTEGAEEETPNTPSQTTTKTYATVTTAALSIRQGAGTGYIRLGYLYKGDKVEILEKKQAGGATWGRYSGGWICLSSYTKLETVQETVNTPSQPEKPAEPEKPTTPSEPSKPSTVTKTYGTLTGYNFLRVRSGPGTGYAEVGQLKYGDRVEILDQKKVGSILWGRYSGGWICITGYMTLKTVTEQTESTTPSVPTPPSPPAGGTTTTKKTFATITAIALNIRKGPGTGYARVGGLSYGARVEILEQKVIGKDTWGRIEKGWICLTGYAKLETETQTEDNNNAPQVGNTMTVTALVLNIRSGAGTNYATVGALKKGTKVIVLEEKNVNGTIWARIAQGWVSKDYLTSN